MKSISELIAGRRFQDSERAESAEPGNCINCGADLSDLESYRTLRVCDHCGFHYSLSAHRRIAAIVDPGSFRESDRALISIDPLAFTARERYRRSLFAEQRRTGLSDAAVTGRATIAGRPMMIAALDFRFMGGSVGCAAGEKLARTIEAGARRRRPVVVLVASDGVRMQEGPLALMQFAKIAEAASRLAAAGEPLIVVFANPTLGASYAVFGGLADFIVAEPGALIGYARTRDLRERAAHVAVEHARTAEAQLSHALVDEIVERSRLRDYLTSLMEMLAARPHRRAIETERPSEFKPAQSSAWSTIQLARQSGRPTATDYIGHFSDSFIALRGDRSGADDSAVVCGLGMLGAESVMYVGLQRATDGDAAGVTPVGLRKAEQAFRLAVRLRLPIVTLIDGVTLAPSIAAEDGGLASALGGCLSALAVAQTPVVGAIIGEARGEAALALGLADRLLMLQHAAFEVISPEAAASILYRDPAMADNVAPSLKPTARDCKALGIVDEVVREPAAGAHADHEAAARLLGAALLRSLAQMRSIPPRKLTQNRFQRHRRIGRYSNFLKTTVTHDVAQLGEDLARRAGGALAAVTRRARRRAAPQPDDSPESLPVP